MVSKTGVTCFLCKANIPFSNNDKTRLKSHLESEHQAFFGMDYLVAGCTMSDEERVAIQNVVKNRQPKLIQLEVESDGESVDDPSEEGDSNGPTPAMLEPETTLSEGSSPLQITKIKIGASWSETEGVSPPRTTPPRKKQCIDCSFTCKLQIQLNRHKKVCKKDGAKTKLFSSSKKIKSEKSPSSRRTPSSSDKKEKRSPYASPGKGYPCKECDKEFRLRAAMERHFEDIHQPGSYPCNGEGCGKIFTSRNKQSSHYSRNCNPNNPAGAAAIARRKSLVA